MRNLKLIDKLPQEIKKQKIVIIVKRKKKLVSNLDDKLNIINIYRNCKYIHIDRGRLLSLGLLQFCWVNYIHYLCINYNDIRSFHKLYIFVYIY